MAPYPERLRTPATEFLTFSRGSFSDLSHSPLSQHRVLLADVSLSSQRVVYSLRSLTGLVH
jgi:hypothetical protein